MPAANLNQLWAKTLVSQLCVSGVREAVICPGSRSAPLALAFAEQSGIRTWSVIDERSAGFFALGLAKESGSPAALVCTSGTAGANFYPAVVEASMSRVPMIVLTADRPPELHGWGALQTIPQQGLYGQFACYFADLGIPENNPAVLAHLRATASAALARSARGVSHLNVPFREPLVSARPELVEGSPSALRIFHPDRSPAADALLEVAERARKAERGLIVCGPISPSSCEACSFGQAQDRVRAGAGSRAASTFVDAVLSLSQSTQYPVLAECGSQLRFSKIGPEVVSLYDALLHHAPFASAYQPEVIFRFGGPLISKRLQQWLDGSGAFTVVFTDEGKWVDLSHTATLMVEGSILEAANYLTGACSRDRTRWSEVFASAERNAREALAEAFLQSDALTEPRVAYESVAAMPPGANLVLSSSMPVRDVDAFAPGCAVALRAFVNRGANGIDGMVSTSLGIAASSGRPTLLLSGDLAFLHDLGGLLIARQHQLSLTSVVVNNDGGGIFSFLPIAQFPEHFEEFFGTPHGLDFSAAAQLFNARWARPKNVAELKASLGESLEGGLHVIEIQSSRKDNPASHRVLFEAISNALGKGRWA